MSTPKAAASPEPSGDACDSYHRYREDMALLADAGLDTYRFSVEWSRIEPEPGFVSHAEIDHYRRMVEACHEFGLTPMVTLLHFTVPRWMADQGGWRHPDAVDLFARYTESALPVISDGVQWVCTINEPNIMSMIHGKRETDLVAPPYRRRTSRSRMSWHRPIPAAGKCSLAPGASGPDGPSPPRRSTPNRGTSSPDP